MKKTTSPYIKVKRSSIHGSGVYAKKDIPVDTEIIEYVGEKISKKEAERRAKVPLNKSKKNSEHGAVYLFVLNKRYDIDGYVPYNTARFINHSCEPNCETVDIDGHIWIVSIRNIKKGEELTYNYGYAYDGDDDEHKCLCRTASCIGYILDEEEWPKYLKSTNKTFRKNHKLYRKSYLKSLR